jgi:prevent-host-death family protein
MASIGIAALKARLSRYLEQVKGGHEVVITDRGLPVAKLVPVRPGTGRIPTPAARQGRTPAPGQRTSARLAAQAAERATSRRRCLKALLEERKRGR